MTKTTPIYLIAFSFLLTGYFFCFAESYEAPDQDNPLESPWCWNEIEYLQNRDIIIGTEDSNGLLWFATSTSVFAYDGYQIEEIMLPENFHHSGTLDLHIAEDGRILIYLKNGLLLHDNSGWITLDRFSLPSLQPRNVLVETANDHVYVVTPEGLFEVVEHELVEKNAGKRWPDLSLTASSDSLWIKYQDEVYRIPIWDGSIDLQQSQSYDVSELTQRHEWNGVIANPHGDVVITTSSQSINPYIFNQSKQVFEESDLIDRLGNQSVNFGQYIGVDKKTLLLHGKSSAVSYQKGEWKELNLANLSMTQHSFIFQRKNGNIIIGGKYERIYEVDYSQKRWKNYKAVQFECEGVDKSQWFLSFEGEVLQHIPKKNQWIKHTYMVIDTPMTIMCSSEGTIWVAGAHHGVAAVSYLNAAQWKMDLHPRLLSTISHLSAQELSDGKVAFGSGHEISATTGGLVQYHRNANGWTYNYLKGQDVPTRVVGIAQRQGELWLGGIEIKTYHQQKGINPMRIPGIYYEWIDTMLSDPNQNIWVGLWGNGIFRFDGSTWTHVKYPDQLASNNVVNMVHDPLKNDLWIITNEGISKYSMKTDIWIPHALNLSMKIHREGGTVKVDRDSNLWINKAMRSWYFRNRYPIRYSDNKRKQFQTIRYQPDTQPPLVAMLDHDSTYYESSNVFLSWIGRDYYSETKENDLYYSYRMNNGDWSSFQSKAEVILNDLSVGSYTFEVQCRDQDGNLSEVISTSFHIKSYLFKKDWVVGAIIVFGVLLIGMIAFIVRLKIQGLIQMENFKIQFFTNISHELRTPLTAIKGPLEQLLRNSSPETKEKLSLAHRNTEKMLRLVDQLLEFRKHSQGFGENYYTHEDMLECLKNFIELTKPLATEKSLSIISTFGDQSQTVWFDKNKLERIIDNLILNAIKYTPAKGQIRINSYLITEHDKMNLHVSIEDNGVGIPKNEINHIFDPYYRGQKKQSMSAGAGLGLALVKTLVDSMKGSISVVSPINNSKSENPGTRFSLVIPVYESIDTTDKSDDLIPQSENLVVQHISNTEGASVDATVLIIEDDEDIQNYLESELRDRFNVLLTKSGRQGMHIAKDKLPDLILSDIMMDDMDGYQACKAIKQDPETSHIPVIFLSALKGDEHIIRGLECGAEDFLSKPINPQLLKQKLSNYFIARKSLRQLISKELLEKNLSRDGSTKQIGENVFIEKMEKIILENLDDSNFDTEILARKLNMSRITLYRKYKAITGLNPSSHIKDMRMKKAAELLQTNAFTVAEVADKVGFQGSSYLISSFKAAYGCTPKQFQVKSKMSDS